MSDIFDPAPFWAHPEFPKVIDREAFGLTLQWLVREATAGPCAKSKRGALLVGIGYMDLHVNAPSGGRTCDGSAACRASCARTCNHAEERVILGALKRGAGPLRCAHVIHVAVGADGSPRNKAVPGCETCSRLMLESGVGHVWLWGGQPALWQVWTMADFHTATLANLGLYDPLAPVADLGPFVRVTEVHAARPGWIARFKGARVWSGSVSADAVRSDAIAILRRAGVIASMSSEQALKLVAMTLQRGIDRRDVDGSAP